MSSSNAAPAVADFEADGRWARWVAKGAQRDRVTAQRAGGAAVILGICLAGWLAALLFR